MRTCLEIALTILYQLTFNAKLNFTKNAIHNGMGRYVIKNVGWFEKVSSLAFINYVSRRFIFE